MKQFVLSFIPWGHGHLLLSHIQHNRETIVHDHRGELLAQGQALSTIHFKDLPVYLRERERQRQSMHVQVGGGGRENLKQTPC